MYIGGDDLGATVVDFGASACKFGFAGEDSPRVYMDSTVCVQSNSSNSSSSSSRSSTKDDDDDDNMKTDTKDPRLPPKYTPQDKLIRDLSRPITSGHLASPFLQTTSTSDESNLTNQTLLDLSPSGTDLFSKFFNDGLNKMYNNETEGSKNPCLFIEHSSNPPKLRQHLTEVLFETEQLPAIFLARDAVMSCYACGKSTGIVVDIGGASTTVTPVHEGWVESKGIIQSPIGGDFMDAHFLGILEQKLGRKILPAYLARVEESERSKLMASVFPGYHQHMLMKLGRDGKDSIGKVADIGYTPDHPKYSNMIQTSYELPDGTSVELSTERFETGEVLFGRGNRVRESCKQDGFSTSPLQNIVCDSVFKCERDQQAALLSTVILAGGGSCLEGTVDRLQTEVETLVNTHTPGWRVKVLAPGVNERRVGSWLGGSILASLGSFQENWMTKAEYDEHGAFLVMRKCP